jgi:hypothetical protein
MNVSDDRGDSLSTRVQAVWQFRSSSLHYHTVGTGERPGNVSGQKPWTWFVTGKMPFKSSRTDKKGGVARFDNSQNVKMTTVSPQTMF